MHVRTLALVTTDVPELLEHEFDLEPLLAEFARRGVAVDASVWHDPSVDWEHFDLIVMRSPWDYPQRTAEFLAWLDSLDASRVLNPPALIRWNLDKRYLLDLEAHGVSIVPTVVASSLAEVRAAALAVGGRIVVKPNIGAGSWGAHLTSADDPKLDGYVAEVLDAGKLVLVEPEAPEITAGGEHGLLFFDGEYSHAVTKGRILADDGGYFGGVYNEDITPVSPTRGRDRDGGPLQPSDRRDRRGARVRQRDRDDAALRALRHRDRRGRPDGDRGRAVRAELLCGDRAGECGARGRRDGGAAAERLHAPL